MDRNEHCTHPDQDRNQLRNESWCDCDWCRYISQREALTEMLANTENRQDEPFVAYVRATCKHALGIEATS